MAPGLLPFPPMPLFPPMPPTYSKNGLVNGPEDKVEMEKMHTYHAVQQINILPTLGSPAFGLRIAAMTGMCFPKPGGIGGTTTWEIANLGVGGKCPREDDEVDS